LDSSGNIKIKQSSGNCISLRPQMSEWEAYFHNMRRWPKYTRSIIPSAIYHYHLSELSGSYYLWVMQCSGLLYLL
jgi:hypothetical protein